MSLVEDHDHACDFGQDEEDESPVRIVGRKRVLASTSSDSASKDDRPSPSPSPSVSVSPPHKSTRHTRSISSVSRSFSTHAPPFRQRAPSHPVASTSRALALPPAALPAGPPRSRQMPTSSSHPFLCSLTPFLHHLSPSLASHAATLVNAVISSPRTLLHLIYLDDGFLEDFIRSVEVRLPKLAQVMLLRKLRSAKEEIEGRGGEGSL